jgi:hypothetical protein
MSKPSLGGKASEGCLWKTRLRGKIFGHLQHRGVTIRVERDDPHPDGCSDSCKKLRSTYIASTVSVTMLCSAERNPAGNEWPWFVSTLSCCDLFQIEVSLFHISMP